MTIAKSAGFRSTARGVIFGIEVDDDRLFTDKIATIYYRPSLGGKGKTGDSIAYF
jgi:hypothetical protein